MKLWEFEGQTVRITMIDGEVFEGFAFDYSSALDNEPDPECISIRISNAIEFELYAPEIKKVELID